MSENDPPLDPTHVARRLAKELDSHQVEYALGGAIALGEDFGFKKSKMTNDEGMTKSEWRKSITETILCKMIKIHSIFDIISSLGISSFVIPSCRNRDQYAALPRCVPNDDKLNSRENGIQHVNRLHFDP